MSLGWWHAMPWLLLIVALGIGLARTQPAVLRLVSTAALWDCLLAGGLLVAFELNPLNPYVENNGLRWDILGAAMTASLALRRRRPLAVWVWVTACGGLLLATRADYNAAMGSVIQPSAQLAIFPAPLVALYTVALRTTRERGRLALAISLAMLELGLFRVVSLVIPGAAGPQVAMFTNPDLLLGALFTAGMLVTAWALGETLRTRRESAALRVAAAEAERAERDRAVAAEERARIARELHDITAHHISVVALQAGTARLLAESGHPPDAELLSGIETASRQAMTEIRQALGVIRSSPDGAAPLPGLAHVRALVDQLAQTGLAVTVDGAAGPLPGALDLAAYRIVQEGLTNVLRHSTARSARVTIRREPEMLEVTVTDDGPARGGGPPAGPGGHGLIGLRERVTRYGGRLHAGPAAGGGFELRASLVLPCTAGENAPPVAPGARMATARSGHAPSGALR